jgi:cytochrome c peroxidase
MVMAVAPERARHAQQDAEGATAHRTRSPALARGSQWGGSMNRVSRSGQIPSMLLVVASLGCASAPAPSPSAALQVPQMTAEPNVPQDPNRVALGRLLFFDPRLSKNRDASCSSCHVLTSFGIDGRATSDGREGLGGMRNTPTVLNAAFHIAQFWDGRASTVEAQVLDALTNPTEMGMPNERAITEAISRVPEYVEMFRGAFPGDNLPISAHNVAEAIGAFERGLVTGSRWDQFVAGDHSALTATEKQGFSLFMQRGCTMCHTGPQAGGTTFEKVGAVFAWPNQQDLGRVEITHFESDRMVFRVPSRKNIAETGPYFHDGSTSSLVTAIRLMAFHQLGIELPDHEVYAIEDWMNSMTGEPERAYITPPQLPPGG